MIILPKAMACFVNKKLLSWKQFEAPISALLSQLTEETLAQT
jgi:hypothetical protein